MKNIEAINATSAQSYNLDDLNTVRLQIVESILLLGIILGIIYLIIFIVNTPIQEWMLADIVLIAIITLGIGITVFRNKIKYIYKSATVITCTYLLAVFNFIGWGLIGLGSLWFILFILMTMTLHTRLAGLIAYFVTVVSMGLITLAVRLNVLVFTLDFDAYALDNANWLSRTVFIIILGAITVVSVGRVLDVLAQQVLKFRKNSEQLALHQSELSDEMQRRKTTEVALADALANLQSLDKLKNNFIDSVSHELRTPLANIQLYHQLLAMNPSKAKDYLETLKKETERLHLIVEQMIHASSDDYDMALSTMLEIDLADLIQRLFKDHADIINNRNIQLTLPTTEDLYITLATPEHIYRAIGNLVDNALKYTPTSGDIVVEMLRKNHLNQPMIGLSIQNTGLCPTEDEKTQWFERFVRGTSSLEMGVAGAGLGLPISQQIIEKYGGSITLDCEDDILTFTVYLPEIVFAQVE